MCSYYSFDSSPSSEAALLSSAFLLFLDLPAGEADSSAASADLVALDLALPAAAGLLVAEVASSASEAAAEDFVVVLVPAGDAVVVLLDVPVAAEVVAVGDAFGEAVARAVAAGEAVGFAVEAGDAVAVGFGVVVALGLALGLADGDGLTVAAGVVVAAGLPVGAGDVAALDAALPVWVCVLTPPVVPVAPTPSRVLMPMLGCTP